MAPDAVSEIAGDKQYALAADFHGAETFVPAFDELAHSELGRFAHLVRVIELLAVLEPADVMDRHCLAGPRSCSISDFDILDLQSRRSRELGGAAGGTAATRDDVRGRRSGKRDNDNDRDQPHLLITSRRAGTGARICMRYARSLSGSIYFSMSALWHKGEPTFMSFSGRVVIQYSSRHVTCRSNSRTQRTRRGA